MNIRPAELRDQNQVREIYLAAFDESERDLVANLAANLLGETTNPRTIHLVAEDDGDLVGHVAFSPVREKESGKFVGYNLGPLAVIPSGQKTGVGTALVEQGFREVKAGSARVILVYGDPEYYARFGFDVELAESFTPPYPLQYPFGWQAVELGASNESDDPIEIACVDSLCVPELW